MHLKNILSSRKEKHTLKKCPQKIERKKNCFQEKFEKYGCIPKPISLALERGIYDLTDEKPYVCCRQNIFIGILFLNVYKIKIKKCILKTQENKI